MINYSELNDFVIIDLINRGDLQAFDKLYDRYSEMIFKQCFTFCLNTEEAKDLMQDVWIKIYFSIKDFKKKSSFSTWLHRVTTNHCLNKLKKLSRAKIFTNKVDVPYHNGMEISIEAKNILSILSTEDRILLIMKYMDNFTYQEISERLGLGESAVKMRISRLIKKLKQEIGE